MAAVVLPANQGSEALRTVTQSSRDRDTPPAGSNPKSSQNNTVHKTVQQKEKDKIQTSSSVLKMYKMSVLEAVRMW